MSRGKEKPKEKIEIDKERKGKKAQDCSIHVEDMIIAGEVNGSHNLAEELKKERKKKSTKK